MALATTLSLLAGGDGAVTLGIQPFFFFFYVCIVNFFSWLGHFGVYPIRRVSGHNDHQKQQKHAISGALLEQY